MIYVDEPTRYNTPLRYKVWSHMWSDECDQELHEMADRIGLQRSWFQSVPQQATDTMKRIRNHYDVTPGKRALAIHYGAQPIDTDTYIQRIREKKPSFVVRFSEADSREDLLADYYGDPERYA